LQNNLKGHEAWQRHQEQKKTVQDKGLGQTKIKVAVQKVELVTGMVVVKAMELDEKDRNS